MIAIIGVAGLVAVVNRCTYIMPALILHLTLMIDIDKKTHDRNQD